MSVFFRHVLFLVIKKLIPAKEVYLMVRLPILQSLTIYRFNKQRTNVERVNCNHTLILPQNANKQSQFQMKENK